MRIAAVADVHARADDGPRLRAMFRNVRHEADVLVLAGDLTDHGRLNEAEALMNGVADVGIPVLAVLGNHDHENGSQDDLVRILESGGVRCIDRGAHAVVAGGGAGSDGEERVGFAGAKGFGGGFGDRMVRGFGETATKAFVTESVVEAEALRQELRALPTQKKVAVLHYAPVAETVHGEPPEIHAFLGTSRLAEALDGGGASLAVHGHAHHGALRGKTDGGVPVWNVSLPVLRAAGETRPYLLLDV